MGDFPRDHRAVLRGDPATGDPSQKNAVGPTLPPGALPDTRTIEHPYRPAKPSEQPGQTSFPPPEPPALADMFPGLDGTVPTVPSADS